MYLTNHSLTLVICLFWEHGPSCTFVLNCLFINILQRSLTLIYFRGTYVLILENMVLHLCQARSRYVGRLQDNRPYSRWLFPTYDELGRCQIQAGHSKLVSLTHLLPRDLVSCGVCVQTITRHLTVNSTI